MQTKALILVLILALLSIPVVHAESASDWYTDGQNALVVGNYPGALTYFNNALAIDNSSASAMAGKAAALNGLGNYTDAIPWAEAALTYRAADPNALNARAFALYRLGQYNASVTAYNTLLAVQNNNKDAYCNEGYAYTFMNQSENAISLFNQCLVFDPSNLEILNQVGLAYMNLGESRPGPFSIQPGDRPDDKECHPLEQQGPCLRSTRQAGGRADLFPDGTGDRPEFYRCTEQRAVRDGDGAELQHYRHDNPGCHHQPYRYVLHDRDTNTSVITGHDNCNC